MDQRVERAIAEVLVEFRKSLKKRVVKDSEPEPFAVAESVIEELLNEKEEQEDDD